MINVAVTFTDGSYRQYTRISGEDWGTVENRFLVYTTETGRIHLKKDEIQSVVETTIK